jgi:hypothetical protein
LFYVPKRGTTWNRSPKIACSNASTALRSASAEVCVYTSAVVLRLECPSRFCTSFKLPVFRLTMVAAEWRRVGNPAARCARAIPARSTVGHSTSRRSTSGFSADLSSLGRTKSSGPLPSSSSGGAIGTGLSIPCQPSCAGGLSLPVVCCSPILGLLLHSSAGNI